MRRNTTRLVKLLAIACFALLITVVIYKTFSDSFDDAISTAGNSRMLSLGAVANHLMGYDANRNKGFFDGRPTNENGIEIDWHDYAYIEKERQRTGLGEHGRAAKLSAELEPQRQEVFDVNGFNGLLSDLISVNRSVKDNRHKG